MKVETDDLLTIANAAERMGISRQACDKWTTKGRINYSNGKPVVLDVIVIDGVKFVSKTKLKKFLLVTEKPSVTFNDE